MKQVKLITILNKNERVQKMITNTKKCFCGKCRKKTDYVLKKKEIEKTIRNKSYKFFITSAYCFTCGEEVSVPGLIDLNIKEIDDQYRQYENIISNDDIEKLSNLYDIGKEPLSNVLGFGQVTINRYLSGQVPSKEYSNIILKALLDPTFMKECLNKNKDKISDIAYTKAMNKVNELCNINISNKLISTISYIFNSIKEVTPLALQKLLYYIQSEYLYLYNKPLFVEDAEAWVHGPVYVNVYNLFKEFTYNPIDDNRFIIFYKKYLDLNEDEKNTIDLVLDTYGRYSGKVLENIAHKEVPWINARGEYGKDELCQNIISKKNIKEYLNKIGQKYNLSTKEGITKYINSMSD